MQIAHMGVSALGIDTAAAAGASLPFGVHFCGRPDLPGVGHDRPDLIDFAFMPVSTPDQIRIENLLEASDLQGKSLLHVGVGNSSFARRLAERCARIDGITLSEREKSRAAAEPFPSYRVRVANKYHPSLIAVLPGNYDAIVDNNLASFACCGFHLLCLFSNYRSLLKPGGVVLTDEQGMNWTAGDARWRLNATGLQQIGSAFGFQTARVTDHVYSLVRR